MGTVKIDIFTLHAHHFQLIFQPDYDNTKIIVMERKNFVPFIILSENHSTLIYIDINDIIQNKINNKPSYMMREMECLSIEIDITESKLIGLNYIVYENIHFKFLFFAEFLDNH